MDDNDVKKPGDVAPGESPLPAGEAAEELKSSPVDPYMTPSTWPVVEELADREVVWGKNQPGYLPLRSLASNTPEGWVLSRWSLTHQQRRTVLEDGADIFVEQMTFGDLLQPLRLLVAVRIDAPSLISFYELDKPPIVDGLGQPRKISALEEKLVGLLAGHVNETGVATETVVDTLERILRDHVEAKHGHS